MERGDIHINERDTTVQEEFKRANLQFPQQKVNTQYLKFRKILKLFRNLPKQQRKWLKDMKVASTGGIENYGKGWTEDCNCMLDIITI